MSAAWAQTTEQVIESVELSGSQMDMSFWSLITGADIIVQLVMLMLLAASVWCWAIIFDKQAKYRKVRRRSEDFEDNFWSGGSLTDLYGRMRRDATHPMAVVFVAAMREWERSTEGKGRGALAPSLYDRITKVMRVTANRELEGLERYLGFLATVGSTAPFVGLFGTVWGIMNSFQAIATTSDTSLAVVAPGIAEALFATAMGLLAAIPAVIAYNKFTSDMNHLGQKLDAFIDEFSTLLSRQVEEGN